MSKHKINTGGLVYSTDPSFSSEEEQEEQETVSISQQKLRVKLDTKQRAGKIVTLVEGFIGTQNDLENLGKLLKTKCGTGGSAKDSLIIIQGDYKIKVVENLQKMGYSVK